MFRPLLRTPLRSTYFSRSYHSSTPRHALLSKRNIGYGALATTTALLLISTVHADADNDEDEEPTARIKTPLTSLVRAYAVYGMCSIPALVDASPSILAALSSVPGLKQLMEAAVRLTFFNQFVGADSAEDAVPLLHSLRAANKGVLFAYSVEVDESEATGPSSVSPSSSPDSEADNENSSASSSDTARKIQQSPFARIVDETIHCIDVAADFEACVSGGSVANLSGQVPAASEHSERGRRTWVAVKITAMLPDAGALIGLSKYIVQSRKDAPDADYVPFPGLARLEDMEVILKEADPRLHDYLTPAHVQQLRDLYGNMERICQRAKERGVKVIVDAEYSWYQPAIDAVTLTLMQKFNSLDSTSQGPKVQPLVYGTFQAYLRRTPLQLAMSLEHARRHNYSLGVKLVRGAYHPIEIASHRAALEWDAIHKVSPADGATLDRPSLSISPDVPPPVWEDKAHTDEAYNRCAAMLIEAVKRDLESNARSQAAAVPTPLPPNTNWRTRWLGSFSTRYLLPSTSTPEIARPVIRESPSLGVLFGTHNWESCRLILKGIVDTGLGSEVQTPVRPGSTKKREPRVLINEDVVERIAIGQLYGMSDGLTDWIVKRTVTDAPFVIKYVPYGALSEVMPYLSRRAIENKSVLGGGAAIRERQRAGGEIRKRIFG